LNWRTARIVTSRNGWLPLAAIAGGCQKLEARSTSPRRSASAQPRMTAFSAAVTGPVGGLSASRGRARGVAVGDGFGVAASPAAGEREQGEREDRREPRHHTLIRSRVRVDQR